jgi:hypothetical protein
VVNEQRFAAAGLGGVKAQPLSPSACQGMIGLHTNPARLVVFSQVVVVRVPKKQILRAESVQNGFKSHGMYFAVEGHG